jgi:hypothetical protein
MIVNNELGGMRKEKVTEHCCGIFLVGLNKNHEKSQNNVA